jgi:hypothetical protein
MEAARNSALEAALDLARMPTLAEAMRRQPLPDDLLALIRVAAGCRTTCRELAAASGRTPEQVAEAALFYLEQLLFRCDGDHNRTLGLGPEASREQRREHMRWLMKWLHPDRHFHQWESVFAARVTAAWTALERGEHGGAATAAVPPAPQVPARAPLRLRWISQPVASLPRPSAPRLALLVVAWLIVLSLLLVPDFRAFWSPFGSAATERPTEAQEP